MTFQIPKARLQAGTALLLAAMLSGCYSVTYDLEGIAGLDAQGTHVKSFRTEMTNVHFIAGLVTPNEVDVPARVKHEIQNANGRAVRNLRITHQETFIDGLLGTITLGIYAPTTIVIEGDIVK